MQIFKKRKTKLSLIEDYIKIIIIKNSLNFSTLNKNSTQIEIETYNQNKRLNENLEHVYLSIFNKLKLNNLSFLILKKELTFPKNISPKQQIDYNHNVFKIQNELQEILKNLKEKMKILKINPEINKIFTKI